MDTPEQPTNNFPGKLKAAFPWLNSRTRVSALAVLFLFAGGLIFTFQNFSADTAAVITPTPTHDNSFIFVDLGDGTQYPIHILSKWTTVIKQLAMEYSNPTSQISTGEAAGLKLTVLVAGKGPTDPAYLANLIDPVTGKVIYTIHGITTAAVPTVVSVCAPQILTKYSANVKTPLSGNQSASVSQHCKGTLPSIRGLPSKPIDIKSVSTAIIAKGVVQNNVRVRVRSTLPPVVSATNVAALVKSSQLQCTMLRQSKQISTKVHGLKTLTFAYHCMGKGQNYYSTSSTKFMNGKKILTSHMITPATNIAKAATDNAAKNKAAAAVFTSIAAKLKKPAVAMASEASFVRAPKPSLWSRIGTLLSNFFHKIMALFSGSRS